MKAFLKLFIMYFIFGVLMVIGILKFKGEGIHLTGLGDATFLVGSMMMFIGCFRLLINFRFLTLVVFSYKKFFEIIRNKHYTKNNSKLGDYHDYLESRTEQALPYGPIILNGICFFLASTYCVWDKF